MEAMDDLLLACRSNSLNLFVESFLKMVSTLLECHEPGLQICATNSVSRITIYAHVTLRFGVVQRVFCFRDVAEGLKVETKSYL